MLVNINGMAVIGIGNKNIKEKGLTLLEALVSTAIVGIGFVAVFQMVQYSVQSIDVSGQRTKSNYLVSMIAEDLIGDRFTTRGIKNKNPYKVYEYLSDQTDDNDFAWRKADCKIQTGQPYKAANIAIDNKTEKWNHRLSAKRIKCRGAGDKKELRVFEICRNNVKVDGKQRNNCAYRNDDTFDKTYIGRMELNLNNGNQKRILYFQIH